MCETVHCPGVGVGFHIKPTQSTSVGPVEILGNYCVAICSVTRSCFTIHHGPKLTLLTPPPRQTVSTGLVLNRRFGSAEKY